MSYVKSLTMDSWSYVQVLGMLEGGNGQCEGFFERHRMGSSGGAGGSSNNNNDGNEGGASLVTGIDRYKTKAASFYRIQLQNHVKEVAEKGMYKGREASRKKSSSKSKSSNSSECSKSGGSSGGAKGKSGVHTHSSSSRRRPARQHSQPSEKLPTVEESSVEPMCGVETP